ncbi:unnamed protein product [Pleuronectes platessa]|uniref:Uncharacterized protein n=1 Tax=Pleuronectes platessa TaxID=8262 RepID=A0A9N7Y8F1_PLEPL|nr:unnamed protein product [Pleuronectes platessa]
MRRQTNGQVDIVRKRCNQKGITGTDGMTDRWHLQPGFVHGAQVGENGVSRGSRQPSSSSSSRRVSIPQFRLGPPCVSRTRLLSLLADMQDLLRCDARP